MEEFYHSTHNESSNLNDAIIVDPILFCYVIKPYSTLKCHDHYININHIWEFNKVVLYNCDFCEQGVHIQKTHCMAKGYIEMQSRFKLLSDGKISIISLNTSKVHDSILRKFVSFFGCKGHYYKVWISWVWKAQRHLHHVHLSMEATKCHNNENLLCNWNSTCEI